MKRMILVDVRISKDEKNGDNLLWLTLYRLASQMKNGGLWHAKKDESITYVCFSQLKNPQEYNDYQKCNPGTLFDITFGLNDFNNKSYVATCVMVPNSNKHKYDDVYK